MGFKDNVKKTSRSSRIVVLNIQENEFTRISTNIKKNAVHRKYLVFHRYLLIFK